MGLKEQMALDAATVFINPDDFGVAATYTPKDGSGFPVTVLFKRGPTLMDGSLIETEAVCLLLKSWVALPASGDLITLDDGEEWRVDTDALRAGDDTVWQIAVRQDPLPTFRR